MSRFNTLAQPRSEPDAEGALLSYFWSLLAGLLVPVLVVLIGLVAVLLNSDGLTEESVRLGTHLYVPLPASFVDQAPLIQLTELVAYSFLVGAVFSLAIWLQRRAADARLIGEAMDVTAGMEPQKANELIKAILARVDQYEPKEWIMAVPFPDMYDVESIKPKQEYGDMLMRGKDELARLGVPYK